MVKTGSEYSPIKEADVDKLLAEYDVKRIIIGHTENSRVKYTYNKRYMIFVLTIPKLLKKKLVLWLLKEMILKPSMTKENL
jgi:hypothetical protein